MAVAVAVAEAAMVVVVIGRLHPPSPQPIPTSTHASTPTHHITWINGSATMTRLTNCSRKVASCIAKGESSPTS